MRISIDTKEDSPEDIRRVISLLEHLLSTGSSAPKDIFANAAAAPSSPPSSGGLFDMFSSAPAPVSASEPVPQPAAEKTDDGEIRIIPYD